MNLLRATETKVLLCLAVLLGGLEIGARWFEVHLSKDVKHIRSLPAVATALKAAPGSRLKVLVIGNSLSREGLDPAVLKEGLARLSGREVELAAMYPDASNIRQWYYGYRRYFDQSDARPDLVLIGTSRPHLLDVPLEADRLAAFYTSVSDMPQLLRELSGDVEAISKALISRTSILFAHRARVQPLVFYNLVPGYTATTQNLAVRREPAAPSEEAAEKASQSPSADTATCLSDLLDTLKKTGTKAVIVAIPLPEPYSLPPSVMEAAGAGSALVMERGASLHLQTSFFPDGFHLGPEGAALFTRQLLEDFAAMPGILPEFSGIVK